MKQFVNPLLAMQGSRVCILGLLCLILFLSIHCFRISDMDVLTKLNQ